MSDAVGYVKDLATGASLPGVNIAVRDAAGNITGQGTTTDAQGFFNLQDIPAGHVVEFRFIGYRTNIPLLRAFPAQNTVMMEAQSTTLGEAVASAIYDRKNPLTVWEVGAVVIAFIALAIAGYQIYKK